MTPPSTGHPLGTALIDRAVVIADKLADKRIADLRRQHPQESPAQLIERLEKEFRGLSVTTGAGTGALAAVPGLSLPLALAASGGDALVFLVAAATHGLSVARVHGSRMGEIEHQRALLLGLLLGSNGTKLVLNAAGRAGMHWGRVLGESVPIRVLKELNALLGRQLLKRYGPRAGVLFLGRTLPLGIGALIGGAGNLALSRQVIISTREAFGAAPTQWPTEPQEPAERPADAFGDADRTGSPAAADDPGAATPSDVADRAGGADQDPNPPGSPRV